jgi:hypothetical protein
MFLTHLQGASITTPPSSVKPTVHNPPLLSAFCEWMRQVFVSYCHLNQREAEPFASTWRNVFTARALGMAFTQGMIDSDNPAYVALVFTGSGDKT